MSLLVTGSIAIDSVKTPHGEMAEGPGGSAVYFSFSASLFVPTRLVGVVGEDYPPAFLDRFKGRVKDTYNPFAAEVPVALRYAETWASKDPRWPEIVLKAADLFPEGLWLPTRAGEICFEKGDYARGAGLLQLARRRLLALEWQRMEGLNVPSDFRRLIDFYRMACEGLDKK